MDVPFRKLSLRSSFMVLSRVVYLAIYRFARYISRLDCSPAIADSAEWKLRAKHVNETMLAS